MSYLLRVILVANTVWLGLVLVANCVARDPPREVAVGGWSDPVTDTRGFAVRGRLVLAERRVDPQHREVAVYVDLQDASNHVGSGMRLYCEFNKSNPLDRSNSALTCELRDANQRLVPSISYPFGGAVPKSEWVYLPSDATIRLRASPFGVYRAGAMAITPYVGALWVIEDGDLNEYAFSGTLVVDPDEGRNAVSDPQIWRGKLELPAVKIVVSRKHEGTKVPADD